MKRLFLCSSFADVANLLIDFANEDLKGKIIAFRTNTILCKNRKKSS